jgi:hypothetical protein
MKNERESRRRVLHWAAWSSLAALVWPRSSQAAPNAGEGLGPRVAGSYLASVQHEGFPIALALITLTRDGAFISNDTSDQGALGLPKDGAVQGAWKQTGPRQIAAKTLYFSYGPDGLPIWIARTTGHFEFDPTFNTGAGTLTVDSFHLTENPLDPLDKDPLDPTAIPDATLNATLTARRITVD